MTATATQVLQHYTLAWDAQDAQYADYITRGWGTMPTTERELHMSSAWRYWRTGELMDIWE